MSKNLRQLYHELAYAGPLSLDQLADVVGTSFTYMEKISATYENRHYPGEWEVPFMKATGNHNILFHKALQLELFETA